MFYLYVFFGPRLRHDHELFYVLLGIAFYMLPLTVFIESTCPNIITAADYIYVIRVPAPSFPCACKQVNVCIWFSKNQKRAQNAALKMAKEGLRVTRKLRNSWLNTTRPAR